jgi:CheY-like chemotaxis protein
MSSHSQRTDVILDHPKAAHAADGWLAPILVPEERALDLGANDYLNKPVEARSLVARVKAVLKRGQG